MFSHVALPEGLHCPIIACLVASTCGVAVLSHAWRKRGFVTYVIATLIGNLFGFSLSLACLTMPTKWNTTTFWWDWRDTFRWDWWLAVTFGLAIGVFAPLGMVASVVSVELIGPYLIRRPPRSADSCLANNEATEPHLPE